jgi:hypothetical protein
MSEPAPVWWPAATLERERWGELLQGPLASVVAARDRDRLPQGLLLVGPPGLGRELAAVEAAALMTCPEQDGPWCDCASCRRVRAGSHPDVAAVLPTGAARVIKIDQIRKVVDEAPGRPYEARRRVWILDGVESGSLGTEAANAFLKTLEEPPGHVRFLLLAESADAVLPTIRSRCQRLALPGLVAVLAHLEARGARVDVPELTREVPGDVAPEAQEAARAGLGPVRAALGAGLEGDALALLRLVRELGEDPLGFERVALAALELAAAGAGQGVDAGTGTDDPGRDLAELASALILASRRTRALNLNGSRQLLACLMGWLRQVCPPAGTRRSG